MSYRVCLHAEAVRRRAMLVSILYNYVTHNENNEDKLVTLHVHLYGLEPMEHSVQLQDHCSFDHWHWDF